ncbi:hypothetical protein GCM10027398_21940 [Azotobacter salinestris]
MHEWHTSCSLTIRAMRDGPASSDESLPETEASASTGVRPTGVGRDTLQEKQVPTVLRARAAVLDVPNKNNS